MNKQWTVVLANNSNIDVVNMFASNDGSTAKGIIQEELGDKTILALIPGFHADYSLSFSFDENALSDIANSKIDPCKIDPFEPYNISNF